MDSCSGTEAGQISDTNVKKFQNTTVSATLMCSNNRLSGQRWTMIKCYFLRLEDEDSCNFVAIKTAPKVKFMLAY